MRTDRGRAAATPALGIAANLPQFTMLVIVNAFVGAMVGIERTVLPLLARDVFGIATASVALSFLVAFGVVKALSNLAAGRLSDVIGRKPLLVAGWAAALPVAPLVLWAPSWGWVVAANVLLGVNQGFAWSATVIMKMDLAGPRRRGFAMGVNEVAGYGAVAVLAYATGRLAATSGPRTAPFLLGGAIALAGFGASVLLVRETRGHAAAEGGGGPSAPPFRHVFVRTSLRDRNLSTVCLAGLVNNLNDAMAWGLLPLYLAAHGLRVGRIGIVAAAYPAAWSIAQLATGPWSDRVGRKPLVASGLVTQGAAIAAILASRSFAAWVAAAIAMGLGTALVYPALLAAVADVAQPSWRASAVGVYRLWRDLGYAVGALFSGAIADAVGLDAAVGAVAAVTAATGLVVFVRMQDAKGGTMRAIDCPCGHRLVGGDDDELFRLARAHIATDHPDMQRTDEQIRDRVAADAYDIDAA